MTYTETQRRGEKAYKYRVRSVRKDGRVTKERVYLGADLSAKELKRRERAADRELGVLDELLTSTEVAFLEDLKQLFSTEPRATIENRYESFVAQFTHDSNAIEGNTLTLRETSDLLFEGLVPAKSLREVNEALNHRTAFDYLLRFRGDITKTITCKLHELVMKGTVKPELGDQIGTYRTVQVYIRGVEWIPPGPRQVPKDMKALMEWYTKNKRRLHPVVTAAYFHAGFELVHPFFDGNGRVGRLLMNLILHKNGFPMVNIPYRVRRQYYDALHSAQVEANLRPLVELLLHLYRVTALRF